jgi:hypothetical protein
MSITTGAQSGDHLAEDLRRWFYEHSHELWPHMPELRFPKPPPRPVPTGENPFAPPIAKRPSVLGREVARLYDAVAFLMWQHGLVMNTHVTINWRLLGFSDDRRAVKILGRYNHEAAKWLKVGYSDADRKRMTKRAWAGGSEHYWIYVHEHGCYEGFHTHQLCVIPPDKATAFWKWSLAAFARLTGQYRIHPDAVWFSPCTRSRGFEPYRGKNELDGVARCWDWFRYLIKSLGHDWYVPDDQKVLHPARDIFKPYPFVKTADVHCAKLAGGSENIRKKAQVAAGFRSKHLKGEFDSLYNGSELEERRRRLEDEAYEKKMDIIRNAINSD